LVMLCIDFFFSSRRRHTRLVSDWSSDVCSSDLCRGSRRYDRGSPPLPQCKRCLAVFFNRRGIKVRQRNAKQPHAARRREERLERSEERRVGEEGRGRGGGEESKKKSGGEVRRAR